MSKTNVGQVGQYAVISIDFNTWFNEDPQPKTLLKNKKQKTKKKIVYPIFLDFAGETTDPFWMKKFNVWANGKLPKNFFISDNVLQYKKGNDNYTIKLTDVKSCIDFFKSHGGLFSKREEIEESSESTTPLESIEPVEVIWSKSDKKNQELLIKEYTLSLAKSMHLSSKEHLLLLQTVRLAIASKNFNKSNIIINNNKIVEIHGLMWDKDLKIFKLDTSSRQIKKKSEEVKCDDVMPDFPKDMIPNYRQRIEKYNKYYEKKADKYNKFFK